MGPKSLTALFGVVMISTKEVYIYMLEGAVGFGTFGVGGVSLEVAVFVDSCK